MRSMAGNDNAGSSRGDESTLVDVDELEKLLIAAARARRSLTYAEVLAHFGIRITPRRVFALCRDLGAVCERNRARGEPELAVLVVRKSDRLPGEGFFHSLWRDGTYDGPRDRTRGGGLHPARDRGGVCLLGRRSARLEQVLDHDGRSRRACLLRIRSSCFSRRAARIISLSGRQRYMHSRRPRPTDARARECWLDRTDRDRCGPLACPIRRGVRAPGRPAREAVSSGQLLARRPGADVAHQDDARFGHDL